MTTSNPISYIFDIIKYIKKNKDSYKNTVIKILGSSVRSLIRSEDIYEISLLIDNYSLMNEFIDLLEVTQILTFKQRISIPNYNSCYEKITINYKDKNYFVDIANRESCLPGYDNNFILTCNNLSIDIEGNISTIFKHYEVKNHCSVSWTNSCVQDVISGKFRVIVRTRMDTIEQISINNDICLNMINLGYIFDYENSKTLTSYPFIKLYNHTDITKFVSNREVSESCCICREQYCLEPNKKTILINCSHDFHVDCLQKWVKTDNNIRCPVCRNEIKYIEDK